MNAPRSPLAVARHIGWLASPLAFEWTRAGLARDRGQRWGRVLAAARDGVAQRRRPTRARMRALSVSPGGRARWRDVPVPRDPGPDGALVHPIAVATCDLDRALARGHTPFPLPLHLGHECVAEVHSVGERVRGVRPGQRVIVPFQISCGTCAACRQNLTGSCLGVPPGSMYGFGVGGGHWGGALSDLLAVPFADAMLVPLPEGVDPAAAASVADNVSDAYRHVGPHLPRLLADDADTGVLIVAGVGRHPVDPPSIALYAGLIARTLGARTVRLADRRPYVRDHAARLGLEPLTAAELRRIAPAALVVDVSGTGALAAALRSTAPDGVCSSAGGRRPTARLPVARMYASNATLHLGRTHARAVIPDVLRLITEHDLQPQRVTTTVARLDNAPGAIHRHVTSQDVKTVLIG